MPDGAECVLASESALSIIREAKPDLVLVSSALDGQPGPESLCRRLRRGFPLAPMEIILLVNLEELQDKTSLGPRLEEGFDDLILLPASDIDLRVSLRLAFGRLGRAESLFREREFYRSAVHREETMSSHLLDEHLALKATLGSITAAKRSLESANRRLETAATRDILSGLLNRASLFERMRHEMRRADVEEKPLSGILLDIDHFKNVNDSFGHLAGDEVIRELGRRMLEHLRKDDYAGRYGGEEFFIILPESDRQSAAASAERIREAFADIPFAHGDLSMNVTASFGVAERCKGELGEDWIERCDRAMYRAKQLGRNRVSIDGEE
jgi:diguanylate cyclase (GGDEF)-like protein